MLLCQNEESVAAWAAEEKPPFLKYYRECHLGAWLTEGFFFCMNWVHSLWNTEKLFSKCPLLWQHPRGTPSPASGYFLCLNRCRVGQSLLSPKCSCLFSSHRTWGGLLRCVPFKNDSPYVSVFNSRISLLMLGCDSVWEGGLEADLNGSFCKKVVHNEESGGGRSRWEIRRWGVALKPTLHPWEPPLVLLSPLGAASRAVQKIKCLLNMKWHYYIVLVMKGGFYYHMCIIVICAFLPSPHRVLRHISNIICWI